MAHQNEKTWSPLPADVAEWMGMWEAVPAPVSAAAQSDGSDVRRPVPTPRPWRERLHMPSFHIHHPA